MRKQFALPRDGGPWPRSRHGVRCLRRKAHHREGHHRQPFEATSQESNRDAPYRERTSCRPATPLRIRAEVAAPRHPYPRVIRWQDFRVGIESCQPATSFRLRVGYAGTSPSPPPIPIACRFLALLGGRILALASLVARLIARGVSALASIEVGTIRMCGRSTWTQR